jgi:hypothetical protein
MKRYQIGITVLLALLLASCGSGGITIDLGGDSSSDKPEVAPVEVGVDAPANGTTLPMAPVNIAYHASCTDGISAVELSINGEVVNSFATPGSDQQVVALQYNWQPAVSGSHTIRVRAQSTSGAWSDYAAATVTIQAPAAPVVVEQEENKPKNEEKEEEEPKPTKTPEGITLFEIKHDRDKFFYGGNSCGSREVTITARVTNPEDVYQLVLFTRFADRESSSYTKWDSGHAMSKKDKDLYSITLTSNKIANYNAYEFAVMRYQIVVEDKDGDRSVRTEVMEDILLEVCP